MKGIPPVKLALPVLVAALALPAAASAQVPTPPGSPAPPQGTQPAPAPAPRPAAAKLTAYMKSGLIDHGRHYVLSGDRVLVTGRLKPAVGGQKVLVELLRKN